MKLLRDPYIQSKYKIIRGKIEEVSNFFTGFRTSHRIEFVRRGG